MTVVECSRAGGISVKDVLDAALPLFPGFTREQLHFEFLDPYTPTAPVLGAAIRARTMSAVLYGSHTGRAPEARQHNRILVTATIDDIYDRKDQPGQLAPDPSAIAQGRLIERMYDELRGRIDV